MIRLDAGVSGTLAQRGAPLSELDLDEVWRDALQVLCPGKELRPIQRRAFVEGRLLESRRNLVVSAPTNGGKSVIGHCVLIDALSRGQGGRALLLEPLRSLAQERTDELRTILSELPRQLVEPSLKVRITTGDVRRNGERMSSPPPAVGELIVATPERLESIARQPRWHSWLKTFRAVIVDEAHLLGDPHRGPTLELLIAWFLALPKPPRIGLLSATLGDCEQLLRWLHPCDYIEEKQRTPPLRKEVLQLEETESADDVLREELRLSLADRNSSALVFVYRRSSAEALTQRLRLCFGSVVEAYHAGLSRQQRAAIRRKVVEGSIRCIVTTTALGLGVNLPVTHCFVRDTSFYGSSRLGVVELLQMLGRAGRGMQKGTGRVLLRPGDSWKPKELVEALQREEIAPLLSMLSARHDAQRLETTATLAAACLSRAGDQGLSETEVKEILYNTLGGRRLVPLLPDALNWLEYSTTRLAWHDEWGRFRLTVLGTRGLRAHLPLRYLAGLGQLFRDLLELDPTETLLERWSPLDHLLVCCLLFKGLPQLRRFSEDLGVHVTARMTISHEPSSLFYSEWFARADDGAAALQVLGTMGIDVAKGEDRVQRGVVARKIAYRAMAHALAFWDRAQGVPIASVERQWGFKGLEGADERWRNTTLWLLGGHAEVLELRSFYYHLCENCHAESSRIKRVKKTLKKIRKQAWELQRERRKLNEAKSSAKG